VDNGEISRVTTVRPSGFVAPPLGVSAPLASGVRRALQHLPDELLRAMVRGLRAHADELTPGILFRSQSSGGCAVGLTLRELAPEAFDFGWLRFWLWQRWRRGIERDVATRFPALKHLQLHFDGAVAELEENGYADPAKAVGLWFAASAEAELSSRRRPAVEERAPSTRTTSGNGRRGRRTQREPEAVR
jgi:hypothetical protein